MRKAWVLLALGMIIALLLSACGTKNEKEVVKELGDRLNSLQSYRAQMDLVLETGETPHQFAVEVWHKQPDYYRVSLTHKERNLTQIILKNDEGVFVLTPHLNKSFRFQSNWPGNQPQVYLYESLVKDILMDENRQFTVEDDQYVFDTAANYHNKNIHHQRIWLDKDLKPVQVHMMDADFNVLIRVHFNEVQFDYAFDESDFDLQRNMEQQSGKEEDDSSPTSSGGEKRSLGAFYPSYLPAGVELVEEKEVSQDGEPRLILRFESEEYRFSLTQKHAEAEMVSMPDGEPVDLGFTVGVLAGQSLMWTYDGVDFWLNGDLPREEMIAIARSVEGQANK